jgi:hypothetical protein
VAGTKAELRHLARGTCDRARLAVNYKISLGQTLTNRPGGGSGLGGAPERSTLESLAMATYEPLMGAYVDHYNRERPHRGLDLYMPMPTDEVMGAGPLVRRARLGGLINKYSRLAA